MREERERRETERYARAGCLGMLAVYAAAFIGLLALLCGCTATKYVPVESVRTEYVDRESVRVDSVLLRDSVVVRLGGDTVMVETWRWRDRVSIVRDTLAIVKNDSVAVPYPVERSLSRWERAKMDFGGMAIGGCVVAIALLAVWIIRRYRRKI